MGAGVAVAVFAAIATLPRSVGREATAAAAAGVRVAEPGPPGLVPRIADQLATRMPAIATDVRLRLAQTVVREADRARIDPLLILAIIDVESGFDPGALSDSGARGLMQLQDATLRSELERAGLPAADPHDPIVNVQAGIRYLRRCMDSYPRQELALMAYNAGPNLLFMHIQQGDIPELFRAYPRRVDAALKRLRRALGLGPATTAVADVRRAPAVAE